MGETISPKKIFQALHILDKSQTIIKRQIRLTANTLCLISSVYLQTQMGASISTRRHFGPIISSVDAKSGESDLGEGVTRVGSMASTVGRSDNSYAYAYGLGGAGYGRSRSARRSMTG